jgi:two-component system, LuxR family, response regulator FixJ
VNQDPIIYIVDDDRSVARSLQTTLRGADFKTRAFTSQAAFLKAYNPKRPACLLLDLRLAGANGVDILQDLRARHIGIPVIMITGFGSIPTAVRSLKLGATDFLEKPVDPRSLITSVKAALALDRQRHDEAEGIRALQRRLDSLTPRERTLLCLIAAGRSNKLIAADLDISIKTVANIRAKLIDKMDAVNTADLVRMAMLAEPTLVQRSPVEDET